MVTTHDLKGIKVHFVVGKGLAKITLYMYDHIVDKYPGIIYVCGAWMFCGLV